MRQLKISKSITNRESLSLERYLAEIGKENLVSIEEEVNLAREIREGNERALDKLVKANLRFVVSVAKQYQNQGLSLPDLINEGNVGLIKAAKRFDETRGFRFISYAVWWIRQTILHAISDTSRIVRLPLNRVTIINRMNKTYSRFEQEFEREPSSNELSEIMEFSPQQIAEIMHSNNGRHISIDAPVQEGTDITFGDSLIDDSFDTPDQQLLENSVNQDILNVISTLTPREADVIKMFFGINYPVGMSLAEIGEKFDLSKERVRQIKENALRRLKHKSRAKVLKRLLS